MKLKFFILILIGAVALLMVSCVSSEQQVKQTSPEEQAIFSMMGGMESAWNQQDAAAYIEFFHNDLNLKLGTPQKPVFYSKSEYYQVLPQRMVDFGKIKMVKPKLLKLDGDMAKMKVIVRKPARDYPNTFNLVKVDNNWQIISNEW